MSDFLYFAYFFLYLSTSQHTLVLYFFLWLKVFQYIYNLFIHLSVHEYLGYFYLALLGLVLWWRYVFSALRRCSPGVGLLDHMVILCLTIEGNAKLFPRGWTILDLKSGGSNLSLFLPALGIFWSSFMNRDLCFQCCYLRRLQNFFLHFSLVWFLWL